MSRLCLTATLDFGQGTILVGRAILARQAIPKIKLMLSLMPRMLEQPPPRLSRQVLQLLHRLLLQQISWQALSCQAHHLHLLRQPLQMLQLLSRLNRLSRREAVLQEDSARMELMILELETAMAVAA